MAAKGQEHSVKRLHVGVYTYHVSSIAMNEYFERYK